MSRDDRISFPGFGIRTFAESLAFGVRVRTVVALAARAKLIHQNDHVSSPPEDLAEAFVFDGLAVFHVLELFIVSHEQDRLFRRPVQLLETIDHPLFATLLIQIGIPSQPCEHLLLIERMDGLIHLIAELEIGFVSLK